MGPQHSSPHPLEQSGNSACLCPAAPAPKGRHAIAQGNALGKTPAIRRALKELNLRARLNWFPPRMVPPLQGAKTGPRALPWAITCRPVGTMTMRPVTAMIVRPVAAMIMRPVAAITPCFVTVTNHQLQAPKGRHEIAQGNALGKTPAIHRALKGRNLRAPVRRLMASGG